MHKPLHRCLPTVALLVCALAGCATATATSDNTATATTTTFVIVRHAEKAEDGSKDPPLADAGQVRAQALATSLQRAPLKAVYATAYQRTQMTAAPSAQAHALPVTTYDATQPSAEFAAQLRRDYGNGTVLVVGHSNTAPEIAAALCSCTVTPMGEREFDRRLIVHIDADGHAALQEERY